MNIEKLFEKAVEDGLFTDFDVCVQGPVSWSFSGGSHVSAGAKLFDIASLTKACTHLLFLKYFAEGKLSPEDSFKRYVPVLQERGDDRELWHFLSYVIQSYRFDYESLRDGTASSFTGELLSKGFGHWGRRFVYDNISSAYLALLMERFSGTTLEEVMRNELLLGRSQHDSLAFHPVHRGLVAPRLVVPTRKEVELRGLVHDPLSFCHQDSDLSVAGLFSDAATLAGIFHRGVEELIAKGFYDEVARNQLSKLRIEKNSYGLGFDMPDRSTLSEFNVDGPLVFAGYTGCRLFFAKRPRVTICFLTNRVLCGDTPESRKRFSQFSWTFIKEVLRYA